MKKVFIATTIISLIWSIVDNNAVPVLVNFSIILLVELFNQ